jgi:hypothetical protein
MQRLISIICFVAFSCSKDQPKISSLQNCVWEENWKVTKQLSHIDATVVIDTEHTFLKIQEPPYLLSPCNLPQSFMVDQKNIRITARIYEYDSPHFILDYYSLPVELIEIRDI